MPETDLPVWIRWAVAVAQVITPVATIILAANAIRAARAALVSAELSRRDFELSRAPGVFVDELRVHSSTRGLTVRIELKVTVNAAFAERGLGRQVILHKLATDVEAWGETDDQMHTVGVGRRSIKRRQHIYGVRQVVVVGVPVHGPVTDLDVRIRYTFASVYAPWHLQTWMATTHARVHKNGSFAFDDTDHQFVSSRHRPQTSVQRVRDAWLEWREWLEGIRRDMGG